MVDRDTVERLLLDLAAYEGDLREVQATPLAAYRADIRLQRFVERTLHIAIECCMDVCHHIISDDELREPQTYAEAFDVLAGHGVLPSGSASRYRLMAQFRNKLVHYYGGIDPEQVHDMLVNHLSDFAAFRREIAAWLAQPPDPNPGP